MAKKHGYRVPFFLREEKQYNERHSIWPSQNAVIDRLLSHSLPMRDVYDELLEKLPAPDQWRPVVSAILYTAALWNPERIKKEREAAARLAELNAEIASKAEALAKLLRKRAELAEQHSFRASDDSHLLDWIDRASTRDPEVRYRFEKWVRPQLERLSGQFDRKYWPQLPDILSSVSDFASSASVESLDSLSAAALVSQKSSTADFLRAFLAALDELELPDAFGFTDSALATITNCALGLPWNECIKATTVKTMRARDRRNGR